MKKVLYSVMILLMSISLVGCKGASATDGTGGGQKVRMNGSTSMEKLVNGLAEVIRDVYPNITVEPQFTGSSAGIESLITGTTDIASISRSISEAEKEQGVVEHTVAIDGIAAVTHPSNTIDNLTKEQLIDIYQGTIRNWRELGGKDEPIVVIGREAGSGTRGAFEDILGVPNTFKYAQEVNETGAVIAKVASIPGAIGYVSIDVIDDSTKVLAIDGVHVSEETIKDGSYQIQRPFIMATLGSLEEQNVNVQNVFHFINSEEGQQLITSIGLISAK